MCAELLNIIPSILTVIGNKGKVAIVFDERTITFRGIDHTENVAVALFQYIDVQKLDLVKI